MTLRVHYRPSGKTAIPHPGISRHGLSYTDDANLVTCLRCLQWMAASVERSATVHYFARRETACGIKRPYDFQPPYLYTQNPMAVTCSTCRDTINKHQKRIIEFAEKLRT